MSKALDKAFEDFEGSASDGTAASEIIRSGVEKDAKSIAARQFFKRYEGKRERKEQRLNLVIAPTLLSRTTALAEELGVSRNALITDVLEWLCDEYEKMAPKSTKTRVRKGVQGGGD